MEEAEWAMTSGELVHDVSFSDEAHAVSRLQEASLDTANMTVTFMGSFSTLFCTGTVLHADWISSDCHTPPAAAETHVLCVAMLKLTMPFVPLQWFSALVNSWKRHCSVPIPVGCSCVIHCADPPWHLLVFRSYHRKLHC